MDRGLLSEPRLLAASRDFVCARLVTYEDAEEGEFLHSLNGTRSGGVENTTFVLLAPDGRTKLCRAGRSPRQPFHGSEDETLEKLLVAMKDIATKYPGNGNERSLPPVPYLADVRRGLNVAACDNQPMVVVSVRNKQARAAVERRLARLAWSKDFRGRFAYTRSESATDLATLEGAPKTDAVFVVQPGTYGLEGEVIARAKSLGDSGLRALLRDGLESYDWQAKGSREIREGMLKGYEWEAEAIESRTTGLDGREQRRRGQRRREP